MGSDKIAKQIKGARHAPCPNTVTTSKSIIQLIKNAIRWVNLSYTPGGYR